MDRNAQRINEIKYFSILRNNYPTPPLSKIGKSNKLFTFPRKIFLN